MNFHLSKSILLGTFFLAGLNAQATNSCENLFGTLSSKSVTVRVNKVDHPGLQLDGKSDKTPLGKVTTALRQKMKIEAVYSEGHLDATGAGAAVVPLAQINEKTSPVILMDKKSFQEGRPSSTFLHEIGHGYTLSKILQNHIEPLSVWFNPKTSNSKNYKVFQADELRQFAVTVRSFLDSEKSVSDELQDLKQNGSKLAFDLFPKLLKTDVDNYEWRMNTLKELNERALKYSGLTINHLQNPKILNQFNHQHLESRYPQVQSDRIIFGVYLNKGYEPDPMMEVQLKLTPDMKMAYLKASSTQESKELLIKYSLTHFQKVKEVAEKQKAVIEEIDNRVAWLKTNPKLSEPQYLYIKGLFNKLHSVTKASVSKNTSAD